MTRSTTEPNLARAVRAAYQMRRRYDALNYSPYFDVFLPPSVELQLRICRYTTFCDIHGLDYGEFMQGISPDGFTLRRGRQYIIIYNDAPYIPEARKRFTIAHEIGHYILAHIKDDDKEEQEADCFARNLLSPIWVAYEKGIGFQDYPQVFGISAAAARM